MGKATDFIQELMTRPLSEDEIQRRQQAAQPRTQREATLDGKLRDTETLRETVQAALSTID